MLKEVKIGPLALGVPMMLAPMAGVTDVPFRRICRSFAQNALEDLGFCSAGGKGRAPAGLYVTEMITARALVEGNARTLDMIKPDPTDPVKSVQFYGVDPATTAAAAAKAVACGAAEHIDLNFGCPVPKVTRKGGGSALPWKLGLLRDILERTRKALDREAGPGNVPLTVKMRTGIDSEHQTIFDAAKIAQDAGCAAVTLHARSTAEYYSGHANWDLIGELKAKMTIPTFGNGDIFSGTDAVQMMAKTGCDGVVVGRGAQGRPWIFADIVYALAGSSKRVRPSLGQVRQILLDHATFMSEWSGNEERAMREMRKHVGWYMRGFSVGGQLRHDLNLVSTVGELDNLLSGLDLDQEYPAAASGARGRKGKPKRPHLPEGWLDSRELSPSQMRMVAEAESRVADGG
ncbi:tRNA dihydrouridine synthase DusB [Winkia neuii]|uniref:tRNA dihydrouridine synthase DusB n=1 Tax=Winkia neuii TaxID=33007 RepID=UPI0004A329E6|nr:tRNA dihydrouridine synthase DusB [Winkia neuii]